MSEMIPMHGGYRRLISFQVAQLVYDLTLRFCNTYIDRAVVPMIKWYKQLVRECKILLKDRKLQRHPKKRSLSSLKLLGPAWRNSN